MESQFLNWAVLQHTLKLRHFESKARIFMQSHEGRRDGYYYLWLALLISTFLAHQI
jgi:hypothetical protein